MASESAIAVMSAEGFIKLYRAMEDIGGSLNVPPVRLPTHRDQRFQRAAQLMAVATWAEQVAKAMGVSTAPEPEVIVEEEVEAETQAEGQGQAVETNYDDLSLTGEAVEDTQYEGLTVSQLRELATDRGVDLTGANNKARIIEALITDDEAEQAT